VIIEDGETLVNCLAYIDLNPIRAGIVERPEAYRWGSLGYHIQSQNKDDFLSMDFGLKEFGVRNEKERLAIYREFVYKKGEIDSYKGIDTHRSVESEGTKALKIRSVDRFRYRTRYFTDSGIIGTKAYVSRLYSVFKANFFSKSEKKPKFIQGLEGIYSLKRLSE
jgi:hypothetical protein